MQRATQGADARAISNDDNNNDRPRSRIAMAATISDAARPGSPSMIPAPSGNVQSRRFLTAQQRIQAVLAQPKTTTTAGAPSSVQERSPSAATDDLISQSSASSDRKRTEYVGRQAFTTKQPSPLAGAVQPFDRLSPRNAPRVETVIPAEQHTPDHSSFQMDYDNDDESLGAPTPYYYTHRDRTLDKEDIDQLRLQQLLHSSPVHFPRRAPTLSPPDGNSSRGGSENGSNTDTSSGRRFWTVDEDKARIRNAVNGSRIPFQRANNVNLASQYDRIRIDEENTRSASSTDHKRHGEDHDRQSKPVTSWGSQAKADPHWLRRSLQPAKLESPSADNTEDSGRDSPDLRYGSAGRRSLIPAPSTSSATPRRISPSYVSYTHRPLSRQSSHSSLNEMPDHRLSHARSSNALRESGISAQNIMPRDRSTKEIGISQAVVNNYHSADDEMTQDWEKLDDSDMHEVSDLMTADLNKMLENAESILYVEHTVSEEQAEMTDHTANSLPVLEEHTEEGEAIPGTPVVIYQQRTRHQPDLPKPVESSNLLRDLARATSQSPVPISTPLKTDEGSSKMETSSTGSNAARHEDKLSQPTPRVTGAWIATPQTVRQSPAVGQGDDQNQPLSVSFEKDNDSTLSTTGTYEIIPSVSSPTRHKPARAKDQTIKSELAPISSTDNTIDSLRDLIENDTDFSSLLNVPVASSSAIARSAAQPRHRRQPSKEPAISSLPGPEERAQELALYSVLSDRLRSLKDQIHSARKGVEGLEATVSDSALRSATIACTSLTGHIRTRLRSSRLLRIATGIVLYLLFDWLVSLSFEISRAAFRSPEDWELRILDDHAHCDLFPFTSPFLAVRLLGFTAHHISLAGAWLLDSATALLSSTTPSTAQSWSSSVATWWLGKGTSFTSGSSMAENWCWGHDSGSIWRWAVREMTGGFSPPS